MLFTRAVASMLGISAAAAVSVDYVGLKNDRGDGIPDFSYSGYRASNEPLPPANRAATKTLAASGNGDQRARIQEALDVMAAQGPGGVVALKAGEFHISNTLRIHNGTTLRGAGPAKTTLLPASGKFDAVVLGDDDLDDPKPGAAVDITDAYVPVGATQVTVKDTAGLKSGQKIRIQRAVTDKWVRANGMADLMRDGKPQTWLTTKDIMYQPRTIASVSVKTVTLDIPLTDQLDRAYMSPQLVQFAAPAGAPREMGLEAMSITLAPTCSGKLIGDDSCAGKAVNVLSWSTDSWMRLLSITGFNNAVNVQRDASRVTVQKVSLHRDHATDNGAGYAADIAISGYQVLVVDSGTKATSDRAKSFPVVTQGLTPGPNAVVRHFGQLPVSAIQPHAHWAHGLLIDNTTATTTLINRATAGSGHGWAISAGVAWNIIGDYNVQSPPLGTNWCVGCHAGDSGRGNNGTMVEEGSEVEPASLFEAQLATRLA